ncbi:hypothetical protein D3C81_1023160 [compost metagenome]
MTADLTLAVGNHHLTGKHIEHIQSLRRTGPTSLRRLHLDDVGQPRQDLGSTGTHRRLLVGRLAQQQKITIDLQRLRHAGHRPQQHQKQYQQPHRPGAIAAPSFCPPAVRHDFPSASPDAIVADYRNNTVMAICEDATSVQHVPRCRRTARHTRRAEPCSAEALPVKPPASMARHYARLLPDTCRAEPCSAEALPVKPLPSVARHYRTPHLSRAKKKTTLQMQGCLGQPDCRNA